MRLSPRLRVVLASLLVACAVSSAGCAWLDQKQGSLIFNPVSGEWRGYRGLPDGVQEVWIPVGSGGDKLHAWWSPAGNEGAPALLYLHGARWNLTGSVTRIPRWNRMGFSVLAIDYRGFGRSVTSDKSAPTESTSRDDAQAAFDHLAELAPGARRYIYGHSLGGSIATDLAVRRPEAAGLILEGAFTNIPAMIKETRWGFLPVSFLVTQRFDTLGRIEEVKMPVLIAHGTADDIVPFSMGEQLYAAAREPKRFLRAEGGSHHNMTSSFFEDYQRAVSELFKIPAVPPRAAPGPVPGGIAAR